mmetsp:Transcript_23432/g.88988  ORF Transcript_23432/g.88988 Transcript_23432/m.88988 type:complete len:215 (-) Transcript_23432:879-1523(-)
MPQAQSSAATHRSDMAATGATSRPSTPARRKCANDRSPSTPPSFRPAYIASLMAALKDGWLDRRAAADEPSARARARSSPTAASNDPSAELRLPWARAPSDGPRPLLPPPPPLPLPRLLPWPRDAAWASSAAGRAEGAEVEAAPTPSPADPTGAARGGAPLPGASWRSPAARGAAWSAGRVPENSPRAMDEMNPPAAEAMAAEAEARSRPLAKM